jgi:3-deoxy-D-manno-octulosonic-acid transferase
MTMFLYNLILPFAFLFFLPGLIIKLIKRDGHKDTYLERFGIFSDEVKGRLKNLTYPVWVHAVSVGEAQIAVSFIKQWKESNPEINFVLSTTTTTGQTLGRQNSPEGVTVIFCPIDFSWAVKKVLKMLQPKVLVLFETEIWPNLIYESSKFGTKVVQVNARISDNSFKGYKRFRYFINPFLSKLTVSCAQTQLDAERLKGICQSLHVELTGNMKFDQKIPENFLDLKLDETFGDSKRRILLAASTHPNEEKLVSEIFKKLELEFSDLRLVLIPRHAERGDDVASILKELKIPFHQRTNNKKVKGQIKCLLADTTGEMVSFINNAEIVIVGKSFTGNDEGQNIIEPALMGKAVIVGSQLRNFRQVLDIMLKKNAILSVSDDELENAIRELLEDPERCKKLGATAKVTVTEHIGATQRTIDIVKKFL